MRNVTELAIQADAEGGAVGQAGQRIVVRQEADLLFGPAPFAQVAERHHLVRPAFVLDRLAHDLDRHRFAVGAEQHALAGLFQQQRHADRGGGGVEHGIDAGAHQRVGGAPGHLLEALVDRDHAAAIAHGQSLEGDVG